MRCEELSWRKYEPSTIRVELNPKTILIASAEDRKNLRKIFTRKRQAQACGQPRVDRVQSRDAESDAPRLIACAQVGGGVSA
jgi:hypothetical protein